MEWCDIAFPQSADPGTAQYLCTDDRPPALVSRQRSRDSRYAHGTLRDVHAIPRRPLNDRSSRSCERVMRKLVAVKPEGAVTQPLSTITKAARRLPSNLFEPPSHAAMHACALWVSQKHQCQSLVGTTIRMHESFTTNKGPSQIRPF
jgi:hypothetical protein